MAIALVDKLTKWAALSAEDRETLATISTPAIPVKRHQVLIREGAEPEGVFLLIEGWAVRYKVGTDGKRQIVGILLPGDFCDIHICVLDRMDHNIAMLSHGKVARITKERMIEMTADSPALAQALWRATLVDEAVLREWLVNIGSRPGPTRLAHLLCELYIRMDNVELAQDNSIDFPLVQQDLADVLGLTPIHINRCLKTLRQQGLMRIEDRRLKIPDLAALKRAGEFKSNYLHGRSGAKAAR